MADGDFTIWVSDGRVRIDGPDVLTVTQALELAAEINTRFGEKPRAAGAKRQWTAADDAELRLRYQSNETARQIALAMNRTPLAVCQRVSRLSIPLRNPAYAASAAIARAAKVAKRKAA